jgi:hypothetical protein
MTSLPHPQELEALDLFEIWSRASDLGERFDPFRFEHRMAAYRQLIHSINRDGIFGGDNRRNPLWGLMFQHQWQFRSGRLGATTRADGRIDPDAPWGYGNYALCVIPWLGATSVGVVPSATLGTPVPATPSRFRYAAGGHTEPLHVPEEFEPGVREWGRFFNVVQSFPPGGDQEPIRLALWKAHKTCLDAVARCLGGIDPAPYSPLELTFLRGWCRMADYLWVAAWPTDFDFMVEYGLNVLPERLLESDDDLRRGAGLPERVRRNVVNVIKLARTPGWRYALNLTLWKRAMRTPQARDEVVPMLDAVFNPRPDNLDARKRLVRYIVRP